MTKKEIKKYVEDQIEYHCEEFGLEREEVEDVVMKNIVIHFYNDEISGDDLVECGNYLGYQIDLEETTKDKEAHKKAKERRKAYKQASKNKKQRL